MYNDRIGTSGSWEKVFLQGKSGVVEKGQIMLQVSARLTFLLIIFLRAKKGSEFPTLTRALFRHSLSIKLDEDT